MSYAPHSYVVRDKTLHDPEFTRAVRVIRTFGEPGKFYSMTNVYLTVDQTKWWTMGEPIQECQIINTASTERIYGLQNAPRTATNAFTIYDSLATAYDDRYRSPQDLAENDTMRKLFARYFGAYAPKTLDVGCGTGLLLDLGVTAAGVYTGVDPSQGMLNELVRKHPRATALLPQPMEQAVDGFDTGEFELVVSLFGSPSYIDPYVIEALPALASRLVVLMHYEEGYLPDYWEGRPPPATVDVSREAAIGLPGAQHFKLNHFVVTVLDARA